ncbi:MAG: hypothetical protein LBQ18_06930 [Campylobacteraceae bacterium]|jgi:hypothetical protein|nr:hypothetical protein [Campylobacteraceae bacterium]
MRHITNLLAAVLVLGFLVGCGGDGGDQDLHISFDRVHTEFPAFFEHENASIVDIKKSKVYSATSATLDSVRLKVSSGHPLTNPEDGLYEFTDEEASVRYFIQYNGTVGSLDAGMNSTSNEVLTESAFNNEFGDIDGDLRQVVIEVSYNEPISPVDASFQEAFGYLKFNCYTTIGTQHICNRQDDNFEYNWTQKDEHTYRYVASIKR